MVDERTEMLLAITLDMNETELRAALIAIVNGKSVATAIDDAYNWLRRDLAGKKYIVG